MPDKKKPTILPPRLSSRSGDEVRALISRLLDDEPDIREAASAELEASLFEPMSAIFACLDTLLDEKAPEIDRLHNGILLGAFLEWLDKAGGVAGAALHILGDVTEDLDQGSCSALAEKMHGLEVELRKSPLTLLNETERSRLFGTESSRPNPAKRSNQRSDEMDLVPSKEYDLSDAAQYADVSESTIEQWISAGQVGLTGRQDASSGKFRFTAQDLKALRTHVIALAIDSVIDEPDEWLDSPNPWMGGHSPRELLGTDREQLVIDVVEGIKHGAVA